MDCEKPGHRLPPLLWILGEVWLVPRVGENDKLFFARKVFKIASACFLVTNGSRSPGCIKSTGQWTFAA